MIRKYVLLSLAVVCMLSVASVAANNGSVSSSADFSLGSAYELSVYNNTSLEFPAESNVGDTTATSTWFKFETTALEVYLKHNYAVKLTGTGTAFVLDNATSDYTDTYVLPAEWVFQWSRGVYPTATNDEEWSGYYLRQALTDNETASASVDANPGPYGTDGDLWARIFVRTQRNGLDDPKGTYAASLEVTVSDLS